MAAAPRFDLTAPVPPVEELGRVHLIAIGGSGMSALARLLLAHGVPVSGSDRSDSPTLQALGREGAKVVVGHDPAHVTGVDTVVISSAIPEDNVELAAARAAGLRVLHRAQGIAALLHGRDAVAVAGANGKTTTSAMTTVALQAAGADPGYVVGAPLAGSGTNAAPGGPGSPVVVEADESDGSFLVYRPEVAVVTNVQPDHLDFYGTFAEVEAAYAEFAGSLRSGGLLVACADDAGSAVVAALTAPAGTYDVADDEPVTHAEADRIVAPRLGIGRLRRVPPKLLTVNPGVAAVAASLRISHRRFTEATGWTPSVPSIRDGWPA